MTSRRRTDVQAPRPPCALRFAIYTRASTEPDLAAVTPALLHARATFEQSVLAHADEGCHLAGATYDDVVSAEAPDAMPAFDRLLGHVQARRIDHVVVLASERARGPLPVLVQQIARLKDAGAHVCAIALFEDATLGVLEPMRVEALA